MASFAIYVPRIEMKKLLAFKSLPEKEHFGSKSRVLPPRYTEEKNEIRLTRPILKPETPRKENGFVCCWCAVLPPWRSEGRKTGNTRETPERQQPEFKMSLEFFSNEE